MGDRKVANHYIPPDFDPSKIPKGKKLSSKDGTVPVRMMLPFSMQCTTCGEFLYQGRKFNSKKEKMKGPEGTYLGIQRFRFYIKCSKCARHISFVTDPKNSDYQMEKGATRNYEIKRDKEQEEQKEAEEQEQQDQMQALENRVLESQREQADLNNLEEIRAMNARHKNNDPDAIIQQRYKDQEDILDEDDEELVKQVFKVKRLDEQDEKRLEEKRRREAKAVLERQQQNDKKKTLPVLIKRKRKEEIEDTSKKAKDATTTNSNSLGSLLGGYGSSDDESSDE